VIRSRADFICACDNEGICKYGGLGWFLGTGVIWGSSFLLIKIGVAELTPLQLIMIRVGTAAIALTATLYLMGRRFPKDWPTIGKLVVVGLFNIAVPFFLITWGEQTIDSGLATVLNSTVPLFSLVIAHFALVDERITGLKVAGLASGFVGVIILTSRNDGRHAGGQ
jgi:drug/metabolite transporter (DMT)-like permease